MYEFEGCFGVSKPSFHTMQKFNVSVVTPKGKLLNLNEAIRNNITQPVNTTMRGVWCIKYPTIQITNHQSGYNIPEYYHQLFVDLGDYPEIINYSSFSFTITQMMFQAKCKILDVKDFVDRLDERSKNVFLMKKLKKNLLTPPENVINSILNIHKYDAPNNLNRKIILRKGVK